MYVLFLCLELISLIFKRSLRKGKIISLSLEEQELSLLSEGKGNTQICQKLDSSEFHLFKAKRDILEVRNMSTSKATDSLHLLLSADLNRM